MAHDEAYREAEKKIKEAKDKGAKDLYLSGLRLTELPESIGQSKHLLTLNLSSNRLITLPETLGELTQLKSLNLSNNLLTTLPDTLGDLTELEVMNLSRNKLTLLPETLGGLKQLQSLSLHINQLMALPDSLGQLTKLKELLLYDNQLKVLPDGLIKLINLEMLTLNRNQLKILPDWLGDLSQLRGLYLIENNLADIPFSIAKLDQLINLNLEGNPLNPELGAANKEGLYAIKAYLKARSSAQIILNEAKLILVGEGEVGKSCLLGALRNDPWEEGRPTTHGIEIKTVIVTNPESKTEITLNGWDFGGQRVYRPTHQLFFSSPAVYLVVWKPREGPQQGFVKEWIKLIKHREPDAKILVVATHGGPQQRQPDIDRQELWDLFSKDTVLDFFFVESKPDDNGERRGIEALKRTIARVAASLPEVGRSVPKSFQEAWQALQDTGAAYLPLEHVLAICHEHQMDDELARLFVTISHRLGHLIHYEHDPTLRDIVVLKPDWLATAISFVLDDETTRAAHGLVHFSRLSQLWDDPARTAEPRYPVTLHSIFLRLMERFDLSYRVAGLYPNGDIDPQSLIAQLVPDNRPENFTSAWISTPSTGDIQQTQICCIVDDKGHSATAEGLFYQLIVRLHKYSLGRVRYADSVHWQRGLILDDDYNGRALLEHIGNDVKISVRAPYPEFFLAMLTREVKYLVESFWEGLHCDVMVPCLNPDPCIGLFEVRKLIENKKRGRPEQPCPVCNEWQNIDSLLLNAPAAQPDVTALIFAEFAEVKEELAKARQQIMYVGETTMKRFDRLDDRTRRTLSRVDKTYTDLIQIFTGEAKEGPRLFSLVPVERRKFNPREWTSAKFCLTLWCEHSRLPLPELNGKGSKKGVYELDLTREWFKKAAPLLKVLTGTLSLVLPVASSAVKLAIDDATYKQIENELDFGKEVIDASLSGSEKVSDWLGKGDSTDLERGEGLRAQGATLRELHAILKVKAPGFGGLIRVMNKRQEFLWVHPMFEKEY